MTDYPFDMTGFRAMFPELKSADLHFLRVQWAVAQQYAARYTAFLPGLNTTSFMLLVAHIVKLNFLAQMGMHVNGDLPPLLTPPSEPEAFRKWLEQTKYGYTIG